MDSAAQYNPVQVHGPREKFVFPPEKDDVYQYNYANSLFSYVGDWKGGKKNGKGRFTIGKSGYYEGEFLDGEITGKGYRVFGNKATYEGEFLNGEFHGVGVYDNPNTGEHYEGEWKSNKRDGKGVLKYPDGTVYTGSFLLHRRHGEGSYTDLEGNSYVGEWANNQISGKGRMEYANGDIYTGEFLNGKRHGIGKMIWKSKEGLSFEGVWENDDCSYLPQSISVHDLPPYTPGETLSNFLIHIEGGEGESGRKLKVQIEIGRISPYATQKRSSRGKKSDSLTAEPKYIPLDHETQENYITIITENGVGAVPPIDIPKDVETSTLTLIVTDCTAVMTLPQTAIDFIAASSIQANDGRNSSKGKFPKKNSLSRAGSKLRK